MLDDQPAGGFNLAQCLFRGYPYFRTSLNELLFFRRGIKQIEPDDVVWKICTLDAPIVAFLAVRRQQNTILLSTRMMIGLSEPGRMPKSLGPSMQGFKRQEDTRFWPNCHRHDRTRGRQARRKPEALHQRSENDLCLHHREIRTNADPRTRPNGRY